jgi:hypothetical protein
MKKTAALLFIVSFICVQSISAQVPGYQGKRFSVGYNASTFFYTSLANGIDEVFSSTRLSYKTEINVNYVLSRKVLAGFSFYYAKQKQNYVMGNMMTNNGYYYYEYAPKEGMGRCKLFIYEVHFQFFRKNFVAPAGLYNQFSIGLVKYSLADEGNKVTIYDNNAGATPVILDGPATPYTTFKLGYAIGKTNPIGRHLYLNTALGINFFQGGDGALINKNARLTSSNYLLANFNRNLRTHNLFELKLGLGWLAF